jgi:hypothetical protein
VDIRVVDDSDWITMLDRAVSGGISVDSVRDMVDKVIAEAAGRPIRTLTIAGHGRSGDMNVGAGAGADPSLEQSISNDNFEIVRPALAELAPLFAPDGEVILDSCNIAEGDAGELLLSRLSSLFGVPVRGGTELQWPTEGLEGEVVSCYPRQGEGQTGRAGEWNTARGLQNAIDVQVAMAASLLPEMNDNLSGWVQQQMIRGRVDSFTQCVSDAGVEYMRALTRFLGEILVPCLMMLPGALVQNPTQYAVNLYLQFAHLSVGQMDFAAVAERIEIVRTIIKDREVKPEELTPQNFAGDE